jgi:hypothetical protein
MGQLYDSCQIVETHIERENLDKFRTMGQLAMRCGFLLNMIGPDDPDDPEQIGALREAAHEVLGLRL